MEFWNIEMKLKKKYHHVFNRFKNDELNIVNINILDISLSFPFYMNFIFNNILNNNFLI